MLLILDEAPRLKDRLDLKNLMTTSASSGMSVLLALQEVTDFDEKERDALRVAAENVPGVRAVEDRLVWVEPVSGTIIDAPKTGRTAIKPAR